MKTLSAAPLSDLGAHPYPIGSFRDLSLDLSETPSTLTPGVLALPTGFDEHDMPAVPGKGGRSSSSHQLLLVGFLPCWQPSYSSYYSP